MGAFSTFQVRQLVKARVVQTAAAGTFPDCYVFINPTGSGEYYEIVGAVCQYDVAGGSSAAADVKVCTATTAPGSGVTALAAVFDLTATARTPYSATLSATAAARQVPPGSAVVIDTSGTLTGLVGTCIEVTLKPIVVKKYK